jgi:hypothetical protein
MKTHSLAFIILGMTIYSFAAFSATKSKDTKRNPNSVACSENSASRKAEALVLYALAANQYSLDKGSHLSTNIQRVTDNVNTDYYKIRVTPGGEFVGTYEINVENDSGCEITSLKLLGVG